MKQKPTIDALINELDSLFGKKPLPKAGPGRPTSQKPEKPATEYWIPVAVVLTRHSWQCRCGASEEGTPSLFVREKKDSSVRLRRCGRDNYSLLPHVLEHLEPEHVDVCPYCFQETSDGSQQLRFPFEEELAPFIRAIKKSYEELHAERLEEIARGQAALKLGLPIASPQPNLYENPEPFAVDFIIGERHNVHLCGCGDANRKLDEETTEQAISLACRGLIDLL